MIDAGLSPSAVQAATSVVTLVSGYVAWVARKGSNWMDEQETRTRANETRSWANRQALSAETDTDTETMPPADDPADDRLGPAVTDGGEEVEDG